MKYLLVGLGNIGDNYIQTRHNIGFMVVDYLASQHEGTFTPSVLGAIAKIKYRGRHVWLLKPSTYINNSGQAVKHYLYVLKLQPEKMLIVTDDISLPFGRLRLRSKGGDGGHNGLKSIADALQTTNYPRLRFGIGKDFPYGRQADYVLDKFSSSQQKELPTFITHATQAACSFCFQGLANTMCAYNTKL